MRPKLVSHGPNAHTVYLANAELYFSYNTLVGFRAGSEVYASNRAYSRTTTGHMNKHFNLSGADRADPDTLTNLLDNILGDWYAD